MAFPEIASDLEPALKIPRKCLIRLCIKAIVILCGGAGRPGRTGETQNCGKDCWGEEGTGSTAEPPYTAAYICLEANCGGRVVSGSPALQSCPVGDCLCAGNMIPAVRHKACLHHPASLAPTACTPGHTSSPPLHTAGLNPALVPSNIIYLLL